MEKPLLLIIGAGEGVSMGVARKFAQEGFRLALIARNAEKLEQLATELRQMGAEVTIHPTDIAKFEEFEEVLDVICRTKRVPSAVLYNAAVFRQAKALETDPQTLLQDMKINVAGLLAVVRQVAKPMELNGGGALLVTGGGLALHPSPDYTSLSAGKAALRTLVHTLHQELKPMEIHVATVTIAGFVKPGTHFDPARIAAEFWELYQQEKDFWETEKVYK